MTADHDDPREGADDDAYWMTMSGSRWTNPKLAATDVASLLEIDDPATLLHKASGLPQPARGEWWSLQQVYDYILVDRADLRASIPRLYPFTSALRPARFLFGQIVDGMAVHAWQPSDGRGPIAVAYAGPDQGDPTLHTRVEPLLESLPWATAVCCPSTVEVVRAPDHADQPYVMVADRVNRVGTDYKWFEIAGLLRVDLPWWSAALRDVEAISAWQPGAPVQRLRPHGSPDPRRLRDVLTVGSSEYVIELVPRIIELSERKLMDDRDRDLPARRGLIHAAVADIDPHAPVADITAAEATLLLHQPCPGKGAAEDILELVAPHSPIVGVPAIPRDSANPLAQEWISSRLEPVDDGSELGFWRVRLAHGLGAAASTVYRDRFNPHTWVVVNEDMVYATVARSVPATGQLTELHYEPEAAFFRDSIGQVWPLPATGFGATGTGPNGGRSGRQTLVEIVTNLILDASGEVHRREVPYRSDSALATRVATTEPPLVLRPGDPALAIDVYR
ncbi:MAG: hypothetical protein K2X52_15020 [Mycobacteriaceae bacterium]|nr:hypothetical protein [Mycobacteriaceae bacterium]